MEPTIILFVAGMLGALVKEIIEDNKIVLPKIVNGEMCLGFLGSIFIGGIAGYLVDNDPITAGLGGYAGMSAITSFITKKNGKTEITKGVTEDLIRKVAMEEGVDPDLALKVAKCESGLDYKAVNINQDGSRDRGLYQINEKYHPEISEEEAFNPITATQFFCKAFKAGNLSWWNATKSCWQK